MQVVAVKVKDLAVNRYSWSAELAAARLKGATKVLEGSLAGALRYSRENPGTVRGIVEIMIDVYSYAEEFRITTIPKRPEAAERKQDAAIDREGEREVKWVAVKSRRLGKRERSLREKASIVRQLTRPSV